MTVWHAPADVDYDSAVAEQLTLMETYADGEMTRADFLTEWRSARRLATTNGEQVGEDFAWILDGVDSEVRDYPTDPAPPEADDPSEDPLRAEVDQARIALGGL
ncbi:hypothetical protein [Nocardia sp. AG03]|uniref:hypothetical protein n=1 Tax=Nocardia sp. AG03 TaxID=3025312 RepID=UPI0024187AC0|nr:hypothetical protein [Nocardia sp. AG03]